LALTEPAAPLNFYPTLSFCLSSLPTCIILAARFYPGNDEKTHFWQLSLHVEERWVRPVRAGGSCDLWL